MTPMSMEWFVHALGHGCVEELIVTGFIDDGSSLRRGTGPRCQFGQFHPLWGEVYLKIGEALLRFKALEDCSGLLMEHVERIECSFEVDPDDVFGVMSMLRMVLPSGREELRVSQVDVYTERGELPTPGVVTAFGLASRAGDYLFINPQDVVNRIHVGGIQARDEWLSWLGRRDQFELKSYPVVMADDG